jgi:hypothetical protein
MLITYRHLCRSEATSSLIPERRLSTNRVVSEAFVQDFVLEFDGKRRFVCGDSVKRGLHPRSTYKLQLCIYQPPHYRGATELAMENDRHNTEIEYDAGDRSPGTRLMRYYVSDDPRPDLLVQHGNDSDLLVQHSTIADKALSQQHVSTLSAAQDVSTHSEQVDSTENAVSDAESTEKNGGAKNDGAEDDVAKEDATEAGAEDDGDAEFRDLEELRGDVLYDIAGRYSHRDILQKIATLHPQVSFGSKDLTWRIANSIKACARKRGVTHADMRAALDATRSANGVESPKNYRARSQTQQEGVDMSRDVTTPSGDSDGLYRREWRT